MGVPVIGSGDVFSAEDAARMLTETAADAVFIARGTYGNPWVFGDARALALDGAPVPERGALERIEALREHLTLLHETQPFMARGRALLPAGISRACRMPPRGAAAWCSARPTTSSWPCSTRPRPSRRWA
ncbi:MAG: tRNA-dihydrouridine synthase [Collinsella sp.]